MSRLIVWGAGDLGSRVALRWRHGPVLGLTRTGTRHAALQKLGVVAVCGSAVPHLQPDDRLLIALPGDEARRAALDELAAVTPPRRVVLVTSTAYYGPAGGTIDEETLPAPDERARLVVTAETRFARWAGQAGVILRFGGLYHAGRGPGAALARCGAVRTAAPNRTLALIHYDDAASTATGALERSRVSPVYLAVTPPCPSREEFYTLACARLGLPLPTFSAPLAGHPARYDVSRLRRDLLPVPAHPHWHAALPQIDAL